MQEKKTLDYESLHIFCFKCISNSRHHKYAWFYIRRHLLTKCTLQVVASPLLCRGGNLLLLINRQPVASTAVLRVTTTAEHSAIGSGGNSRGSSKSVTAVALSAILSTKVREVIAIAIAKRGTHFIGHVILRQRRAVQSSRVVALSLASGKDIVANSCRLLRVTSGNVGVLVKLQAAAGTTVLVLITRARHVAFPNRRRLAAIGEEAAAVTFTAVFGAEILERLAEGSTSFIGHLVTGSRRLSKSPDAVALAPTADHSVRGHSGLVTESGSRSRRNGRARRRVQLETVAGAAVRAGVTAAGHVAFS